MYARMQKKRNSLNDFCEVINLKNRKKENPSPLPLCSGKM